MLDLLLAVGAIVQQHVAAAAPDVSADGCERHGGRDELAVAVELEVLLGAHGVRVGLLGGRLDALGHVGHDLAGAQHAVGVEAVVAVGGDGRELRRR